MNDGGSQTGTRVANPVGGFLLCLALWGMGLLSGCGGGPTLLKQAEQTTIDGNTWSIRPGRSSSRLSRG